MHDFFVASIVQGITEALPISSSMHLDLVGACDTKALHVVTGIAGMVFLLLNNLLKSEFRYFLDLAREFLSSVMDSRFIIAICIAFFLIQMNLAAVFQYYNQLKACKVILSMLNVAIILFCDKFNNKFSHRSVPYISVLCNILAIIPGFSRLGTVYAGLRYCGVSPKEAFRTSVSQGIFISSIGIIFSLPSGMRGLYTFSSLLCGFLYYFMLQILTNLDSKRIRRVIFFCCIYRIFLAIYLLRLQ